MRLHLLALAVMASTPAAAQIAGGPPVAYTFSSPRGSTISLIQADGTGPVALYKAANKQQIQFLSLRPQGNEIAFSERGQLKILSFDDRGLAVGAPRSIITPCFVSNMDYHPTDGSLLVQVDCTPQQIFRVAAGASTLDPAPLATGNFAVKPVWARDGSKFYYRDPPGLHEVTLATSANTLLPLTWTPFSALRSSDKLVVQTNVFQIGDIAAATLTPVCTNVGGAPVYGPSDQNFIYTTPNTNKGAYLMMAKADCSGAPVRLVGDSGLQWAYDWR